MDDIDQWLDAPIGTDVPDLKNPDDVDRWLDAPAPQTQQQPKFNVDDIDAFLDAPLSERVEQYEAENPFWTRLGQRLTAGAYNIASAAESIKGAGWAEMTPALLPLLDRLDAGESLGSLRREAAGAGVDAQLMKYANAAPEDRAAIRQRFLEVGPEATERAVEYVAKSAAIPRNPAVQEFGQQINAGDYGAATKTFLANPVGIIAQIGTESAPTMLPALAAGIVNPALGAAVMGGSSGAQEYGSSILEYMGQNGVDTTDPAAVTAAMRDPSMLKAATDYATKRGLIIGTIDAATGKLAGMSLVPAKLASSSVKREAANVLVAQPLAQGVAGSGAEAAAQIATQGRVTDPGAVALEAVGELYGAPVEAIAFGTKRRQAALAETPTDQAAPPAPVAPVAPVSAGQPAVIAPGATVGLQTPEGPIRVRIEGAEGGNVFYTTPDGVTFGMPEDDFSAAATTAPEPADAIRGDATTIPEPPARVTEHTDYGDISDFDPNAPAERPAPAAPSPQQRLQLPDTTAVDRAAAAAREFRKAAVAEADADRASYLHSQADALDNEAMDLRRQLAARSDRGGVGVPAADIRARADLGRLGEAAPAVSEAQTGPAPIDIRQPQTPLERAAPAVSEAVTGPVPQRVTPAPDTRTELERAAAAVRAPEQPVAVRPKPTVEQMVNNRTARLNDPQAIARQTGKTVEEVRAELNRIAGRPNSPIRQVRGKVTIDPKTKQPIQSARAGAYMYLPKRTAPMSILEALSASGGVQDRGGDLASMGADTWHRGKPGKRALINESGIAWNELGDWAEREGYLAPRPVDETTGENYHRDPSEVLAMIDRELRGQKQLPLGEIAEQEAAPEPTADERREYEVRRGLERLQETPAPDATLDEMEAQLTERLAIMNAATVDEAVDMVNAELDALDRIMEDTYGEQWQPDVEARAGAAEAVSEAAGRPEDVGARERAGAARDVDREQAAGRAAEEDGRIGLESPVINGPEDIEVQNLEFKSLKQEFSAFAEGRGNIVQAAVDWVREMGSRTGHEHVVALNTYGDIVDAGTSGSPNAISFGDKMARAANIGYRSLIIVHSHPNDSTISPTDISALAFSGIRSVSAIGSNGLSTTVGLGDQIAAQMMDVSNVAAQQHLLNISKAALKAAEKSIIASGIVEAYGVEAASQVMGLAMNTGLMNAGITKFNSNAEVPILLRPAYNAAVAAAEKVANELSKNRPGGSPKFTDTSGRGAPVLDQPGKSGTGAGYREEAEISEPTGIDSEGPILGAGPSGIQQEAAQENRVTVRSILDRFRRSPRTAKQAARDTTNAVRNVKGPPELRKLSAISNLISFAATVASKDTISARYYTAEKAMARYAEALTRQGARDTASYFSDQVGYEGRAKINKILEHDRLQGVNRKDTGNRIVARMPDTYRGQLAKPGEIVTLNAVESRALMEMRQFFDARWTQFGSAMAKQFGWDGPFVESAIAAAIRDADSVRSRHQAERAMEIFRMIEDMRRAGYVPFARYGDTKISIRPKPKAVPGKDDMQFERPVHVELVSTKSLTDTILDQTVSDDDGPSAIRRRRRELEKDYPRDQYDYEVTPLNTVSDLRKVDLPAVEKMFMLINMKNPEMGPAFYEQIVNEIFEQRKAGFRKQSNNIPGYSADFERSIADYIHQTSSVIARMELGKDVNRAYEATQKHQDKDIAEFWKDYREYVERPGDEFSGLRKIAFWSFIWGSPASAIVNLTQTPLVTIPQTAAWAGPRAIDVMGAALIDAASAIRVGRDGLTIDWTKLGKTIAEKRMIAQLRDEGVLDPVIARDLQGYDRGTSPTNRKWRRRFDRAYDIGASAFNAAEMTNRIAAALGAFRLAQNPATLKRAQKVYQGDAEFRQMVGRNGTPLDMARFMVDETQFMGGKRGRPRAMRGFGSLALQWKQYQANWLRLMFKNMSRMGPEGKLAGTSMLLGLVATAGLLGIPFAEDALDAANWAIKKATGIDPLLERRIARWLRDSGLGEAGAEIAMRGPSREFLGIDLGSRIGMGEMTPDGSIENAFPLLGATVGKLSEVWDRATSGQPLGAAATLMPKGIADVVKAVSVFPEEGYRTKRGDINLFPHEITAGQQLARFFGFQPSAFSRKSEYKYAQRELAAATQEASTKLLTNVAAELALATQARQYGDDKAYKRHLNRYVTMLRENAEQLQDKDLPGWLKIPQPAARAIKARLQQIMNFEQAIIKRSGKMKREEMMDYPLPIE